jgi:hypothetical protein
MSLASPEREAGPRGDRPVDPEMALEATMDSMRLKRWALALVLCVPLGLGALAAPVHAAPILGDTISVDWRFPSFGASIFTGTVTVPGSLVPGQGVGTITIGDGIITLENTTQGWTATSGFNGFIFTDVTKVPDFRSFSLVSIGGFRPRPIRSSRSPGIS